MIIDMRNQFGRDLRRSLIQPPAQNKIRSEVQSSVEKNSKAILHSLSGQPDVKMQFGLLLGKK